MMRSRTPSIVSIENFIKVREDVMNMKKRRLIELRRPDVTSTICLYGEICPPLVKQKIENLNRLCSGNGF